MANKNMLNKFFASRRRILRLNFSPTAKYGGGPSFLSGGKPPEFAPNLLYYPDIYHVYWRYYTQTPCHSSVFFSVSSFSRTYFCALFYTRPFCPSSYVRPSVPCLTYDSFLSPLLPACFFRRGRHYSQNRQCKEIRGVREDAFDGARKRQ